MLTEITNGEIRALVSEINAIWACNRECPGKVFRLLQLNGKKLNPFAQKLDEKLIEIRKQHVKMGANNEFLTVDAIKENQKVKEYDFVSDYDKSEYMAKTTDLFAKTVKIDFIKLTINDIANVNFDSKFSSFQSFFKALVNEQE